MWEKLKKMFGAQDMTVGEPIHNLAMFAIPLLIGNLAQQMYNTVDSIIVGRYVGDNALAAVGTSGPILNLLFLLFMGISTGAGIMVSQYFGARRKDELTRTIGTCLMLNLIASVIIMVIGPILVPPMMRLLRTPAEIYDMSVSYLTIIFLGIAGTSYYNIISGLLRGMGDAITPLIFLIVACLLNIVLDIVFVANFRMATAGVALATILAQAISAVLCFWRLTHMKDTVHLTRRSLILDRHMSGGIIRLGLPSGLTQAIFSMAAIVVQALTNSFGVDVIACSNVVMRVDGFAMMPNFTFGMAMTTYVGQNVGAGLMDRVHDGVRKEIRVSLLISVVLVAAILIFGEPLMRLFTTPNRVVQLGVRILRILAVGYIAMSVTQSLSGVMRGAGDTLTPMWISIITTVVIRMPLAYARAYWDHIAAIARGVFTGGFSFIGEYLSGFETLPVGSPDSLYVSLLVSWVMGALITAFFYKRGNWRKKAITSRHGK